MGAAHSTAATRAAPITLIFFIKFSSLIGPSNYLEVKEYHVTKATAL
jgi:hypothetical protein